MTTELRTLTERKRELAREMGIDAAEIRINTAAQDEANRLVNSGVIVDLHIGCWGGRKKLQPEDLGIAESADLDAETREAVEQVLSLGQKYLQPTETRNRIASLQVSGRRCLERWSYATPWGRWIPANVYAQWRAENDDLRRQYLAQADELTMGLEDMKAVMRLHYSRQAQLVYRRLNGYRDTDDCYVPDYFIAEYADKIVAMIPAAGYVRSRFYWDAAPSMVPMPSMFEEDEVRRQDIVKAGTQVAALDQAQYDAELLAREAVATFWKERKFEYIEKMFTDLAAQFRGHIFDAVVAGLESLASNDGRLVGKASDGLRNLVTWSRAMNAYQDREMSAALDALESELGKAPKYREAGEIQKRLQAMGTIAKSTLVELRAPGRSAREVGISDAPGAVEVKRARRELGIEQIEPLEIKRMMRE